MKNYYNAEINEIAEAIRTTLKEQGVYSELLELAIYDCAQITYLKNEVMNMIKGEEDIMLTEQSREGHDRKKVSPTVALAQDLFESSRKALVELGMTARTASVQEGDEIDKLTSVVEKARNTVNREGKA